MTRFLLIRHGTNDTVGKLIAGRMSNVHLNAEGTAQAQGLIERLKNITIAAIYSSPLERTLQTAAPLASKLELDTIICHDFIELDMGDWTNHTFAEAKDQPWFKHFTTFRSNTRIPGGETMLEAQARFISGLQKLCSKHTQQTVAIVSHADPIKAAIAYYAGIPLDLFQRLEINPASVSIIELYEETARILVVNDTNQLRF